MGHRDDAQEAMALLTSQSEQLGIKFKRKRKGV